MAVKPATAPPAKASRTKEKATKHHKMTPVFMALKPFAMDKGAKRSTDKKRKSKKTKRD